MPRRTFTRVEIDEFRVSAEAAPSVEKKDGFSLRDVIIEIADILTEMQNDRGYTIEDLVTWWHDQGVTVSAATLRVHLKSAHVDNDKLRLSSRRSSSRSKATKPTAPTEQKRQASHRSATADSSETLSEFPGLRISEDL